MGEIARPGLESLPTAVDSTSATTGSHQALVAPTVRTAHRTRAASRPGTLRAGLPVARGEIA